jgi:hypothetical protein
LFRRVRGVIFRKWFFKFAISHLSPPGRIADTTGDRQARAGSQQKSTWAWASPTSFFCGQNVAASLAEVCQVLRRWPEKSCFFPNYFFYECFQGLYRHFDEFFKVQIEIDWKEDILCKGTWMQIFSSNCNLFAFQKNLRYIEADIETFN